jgi:hypothetical protein
MLGHFTLMEDFVDLVRARFGFLVESEGFMCQADGERRVTYSSPAATIRIGLGERGDVGITVDRASESRYYSFSFYLKTFFPDEAVRLEENEGRSRLEVDIALMKLAQLLKRFGRPLFTGDAEVFRRMATALKASLE